jgi:hypothetical protein
VIVFYRNQFGCHVPMDFCPTVGTALIC